MSANVFTDGKIMIEDNKKIRSVYCNLCGTKMKKEWRRGLGMICKQCAVEFKTISNENVKTSDKTRLEEYYAQTVCTNLKLRSGFSKSVLDIVRLHDTKIGFVNKNQAERIATQMNYEKNIHIVRLIPKIITEWKAVIG